MDKVPALFKKQNYFRWCEYSFHINGLFPQNTHVHSVFSRIKNVKSYNFYHVQKIFYATKLLLCTGYEWSRAGDILTLYYYYYIYERGAKEFIEFTIIVFFLDSWASFYLPSSYTLLVITLSLTATVTGWPSICHIWWLPSAT